MSPRLRPVELDTSGSLPGGFPGFIQVVDAPAVFDGRYFAAGDLWTDGVLFDSHRRALHCWANDFAAVGAATLAWLSGEAVEAALAALEGHVIRGPAVWPDEVPAAVG